MPLIECGEVRLYVERRGRPEGVPVVFVNGLLMEIAHWARIEPPFSERCPTVVYDCRGQGRSDKPDHPYTSQIHAQDLLALIERLELPELHLVALSNGAPAALMAARKLGARVKSMVLSGAYVSVDTHLRLKLNSWLRAMEIGGLDLRFDVGIPWVWSGHFLERHREDMERWRQLALSQDITASANLIRGAMESGDMREDIRNARSPLLVTIGKEDILTPLRYAQQILECLPHGSLLPLEGAHAAALENPEQFAAAALEFVERCA